MTPPFVFNSTYRGLSYHKCKKKFCQHKLLANFHIKSPPPTPHPLPPYCNGRGAEIIYNQIAFIFSKE